MQPNENGEHRYTSNFKRERAENQGVRRCGAAANESTTAKPSHCELPGSDTRSGSHNR